MFISVSLKDIGRTRVLIKTEHIDHIKENGEGCIIYFLSEARMYVVDTYNSLQRTLTRENYDER